MNFRMQQMRPAAGAATGNVRPSELLQQRRPELATSAGGGDINPSRGTRYVHDGVHDMDIGQIERAMSSVGSGSPALSDVVRSKSRTETDF